MSQKMKKRGRRREMIKSRSIWSPIITLIRRGKPRGGSLAILMSLFIKLMELKFSVKIRKSSSNTLNLTLSRVSTLTAR